MERVWLARLRNTRENSSNCIQDYSIAHFDHVTTLQVLKLRTLVKGGAHTCCVNMVSIHEFTHCVWALPCTYREIFLTVDDCNMDERLESCWCLVVYQVSGEPRIAHFSRRSDIYPGEYGLACKLIHLFFVCLIFAVGLDCKIILTAKFSQSMVYSETSLKGHLWNKDVLLNQDTWLSPTFV